MTKITSDHLARSAYVYVRQSSVDQLLHNPESRRRQYALTTRARALGWQNVIVIDDDLGRSGGGTARPGFERLLVGICNGDAGAVFALEASRLARNGRDWHTLLEFCALVSSLIIDEDGVYDPRLVNDRLLLGMKGAFSELELSTLRQRSHEALRLKAARGDLHTTVAIGYRRSADDRLEQDPDRRIREALSLVFRKFHEIGSVRQLVLWLRQEGSRRKSPARKPGGAPFTLVSIQTRSRRAPNNIAHLARQLRPRCRTRRGCIAGHHKNSYRNFNNIGVRSFILSGAPFQHHSAYICET